MGVLFVDDAKTDGDVEVVVVDDDTVATAAEFDDDEDEEGVADAAVEDCEVAAEISDPMDLVTRTRGSEEMVVVVLLDESLTEEDALGEEDAKDDDDGTDGGDVPNIALY
jgi:hypothetical protein